LEKTNPLQNVLIISGHPNLKSSRANRVILETLAASDLNAEIRYLDKLYASGAIDVASEQKRMEDAGVIVFQFPLYWYAAPAILKQWMEDVYTFGFAFGPEGSKLKGKTFLASTTVGSGEEKYAPSESKSSCKSIETFLRPLTELAKFSEMKALDPIYSFKMAYITGVHTDDDNHAMIQRAKAHAEKVITAIKNQAS